MSERIDILHVHRLDTESFIFEFCSVCGDTHLVAGRIGLYNALRFNCFRLEMGIIVLADSLRSAGAVIF